MTPAPFRPCATAPWCAPTAPGSARRAASSHWPIEEEVGRRRQAAADHDELGLEGVDRVGDADAEVLAEASRRRSASGSPARAGSTTSRPVALPFSLLRLPSAESGRSVGELSASRPSAEPAEAPRGSRGWGTCPGRAGRRRGSPRGRARHPGRCAPRKMRPSITTPPPTPVPSVYITRFARRPRLRLGQRGARSASLSTKTGAPKRRSSSSRRGTPASGMFTLDIALPAS